MRDVKSVQWGAAAFVAACAVPAPAFAASPDSLEGEIAAMRAQMQAMAARIDALEAELAEAKDAAATAGEAADDARRTAQAAADGVAAQAAATPPAASAPAPAGSPLQVSWKGAPQFESDDGWKFKLGGRVNLDAGVSMAPDSTGREDGFGSEIRRARLRVEGSIPGGLGYKLEADFATPTVVVTDAFVTYEDKGLTFTLGQHNTFQGFEELSSSLHTSFMERAAFTDAFNFERRIGVSVQYHGGDLLLQGGLFSDNSLAVPNRNWSLDARAAYMPKLGGMQLHLGGSVHYADLQAESSVRYRQRPFEHFTSNRYIDTGTFSAESERGIGTEAALFSGAFHAAAETYWQTVRRRGFADPTFFGGYVEMGYFLTPGDKRPYKDGVYGRVKPKRDFADGGIGAIEFNVRYDRLDLSDAGIIGGEQDGYEFSLIWSQTAYTKLMLNYAHLDYSDAIAEKSNGDRDYGVDVIALRAQVDF